METIVGGALEVRVLVRVAPIDDDSGGLVLGVYGEQLGFWPFLMVAKLISWCIIDCPGLLCAGPFVHLLR
jgi:hypothetical protein